MRLRKLAALLGAAALTFGAVGSVSATAPTHHKITICHATSSETNPYTSPTVDIASAGYPDGSSGHAGHGRDGVWYPGAKADGFDWGDIIPPYDYGDFHYDGLNWTEAGQAIYRNDCNFPKEEHNPAIHVEKTPSVTTLPAGGGEVTYTYVVTNTGDVELSDVSVSDNKCAPVTYVSGDTNDDELLDLNETWTFTCTTTITAKTTNTATATGHDGDTTVTDKDYATVDVAPAPEPGSLKITKAIPDVPEGYEGSFGVRVTCDQGDPVNAVIEFPDPGFVTIDDIPAGASCAVIETTKSAPPAGFQFGGANINGPVTIVAGQTASITVTNPLSEVQGTPVLGVQKSNDAPSAAAGGVQEGDSVTYTLDYTVANGPVHNGIITDVLPAGVTYMTGSASSDAQFTFIDFNVTTPGALTWKAATVSANGSLTYKVTIDTGAAELAQPLKNTACIASDDTEKVCDDSNVFVDPAVQAETSVPTAPRSDIASGPETTTSGGSMLLILLALAGIALAVAFVTPTPAAIRKRKDR